MPALAGFFMTRAKLTDFVPDPHNANKGTEYGRSLLEKSLGTLGAGRSIVVDKNNVIIAGNKTLETALESGFENAIVVETDGSALVVTKRVDLDLSTDEKAKKLAIADNRVGSVSLAWDEEVLEELHEEIDLSDWFLESEIEDWGEEVAAEDEEEPAGSGVDGDRYVIPIVLSYKENQIWQAVKRGYGVKDDKTVFLKLLEGRALED
jgi:hypothetical protein